MGNVLLEKARAILAHPKRNSMPGPNAGGLSSPMVEPDAPNLFHVPEGYCALCGVGYWIRKTPESAYQCGRCQPSESRVETVIVPGGTTPPCAGPSTSQPPPEGLQIEPAAPNVRHVYWETGTGQILGPAIPEYLARDGETFWVVTTFEGQVRWSNADRLHAKKAFLEQSPLKEIEIIREDYR